jgi:hypothetical protein
MLEMRSYNSCKGGHAFRIAVGIMMLGLLLAGSADAINTADDRDTILVEDSFVNSETPDTNYGSSLSLIAGTETWLSSTKIVYLKFNISSIPKDSLISDATANLRIGDFPYCGNPETISA